MRRARRCRRDQIIALVAQHAVPAIYDGIDYVKAGGLASYGADFLHVMELAGDYTGRVLNGEKPAGLPVVRAEKFELVVNLKTAKALSLAIPDKILAKARQQPYVSDDWTPITLYAAGGR